MTTSDQRDGSDEELIRAFVVEHDVDALEDLLRRHESKVYGLCYRMLGNRSDALDATQEVLLAVFRRVGSFHGTARFSTWLYRLTANACIDFSRRRARAPIPQEDLEPMTSADPGESVDTELDVERALSALPPEQRIVLLLRDLQGLTYEEIAEATGVPIGTVKSRIARGRTSLGMSMEPAYGSGRLTDGDQ